VVVVLYKNVIGEADRPLPVKGEHLSGNADRVALELCEDAEWN
jgi:hypothetical protein